MRYVLLSISITTDSHCSVQDTQANGDAVKDLCEQIEGVYSAILAVADTVHREVNQVPTECSDRVGAKAELRTTLSTGLVTPMKELQKCV